MEGSNSTKEAVIRRRTKSEKRKAKSEKRKKKSEKRKKKNMPPKSRRSSISKFINKMATPSKWKQKQGTGKKARKKNRRASVNSAHAIAMAGEAATRVLIYTHMPEKEAIMVGCNTSTSVKHVIIACKNRLDILNDSYYSFSTAITMGRMSSSLMMMT